MTDRIEKVLYKIVHCKELNSPQQECKEIIDFQVNEDVWQVPEPWSGEINKSLVLFIGKNPSIDYEEKYPIKDDKKWGDNLIEDFFIHRFGGGKEEWVKDGKRVFMKSKKSGKGYYSPVVPNWSKIMKWYSQLTGTKQDEIKPGIDYTITDIVHCKSKKGSNVKSRLIKKCAQTHLKRILDVSGAKLIVVLGDDAKLGVESVLVGINLPLFKLTRYSHEQKKYYFLFMRHTNYFCKPQEKEPSPKNLIDRREMSFSDFEMIWKILGINPSEEYINWLREGKSENWYE